MKLIRLFATGSLGLLGSVLAGCLAEPSYSATPEISLNNVDVTLTDADTNAHMVLTISYQDGDGDLGLSNEEATKAPYVGTRFANNFFINPYVRSGPGGATGPFVQLTDANRGISSSYNQTFVHATAAADNHSMPIKGTLTFTFDFFRLSGIFPLRGETVQFYVSIADRARHESNVIVVPVTFPR